MEFNYTYGRDLTVAPFFTRAVLQTVPGQARELKLLKLKFIGLSHNEHVSYACTFCNPGILRSAIRHGNLALLRSRPAPVISSRTRFIVGATSPARIGRFKLYAIDVAHFRLPVVAQGCLAPGVASVTGA